MQVYPHLWLNAIQVMVGLCNPWPTIVVVAVKHVVLIAGNYVNRQAINFRQRLSMGTLVIRLYIYFVETCENIKLMIAVFAQTTDAKTRKSNLKPSFLLTCFWCVPRATPKSYLKQIYTKSRNRVVWFCRSETIFFACSIHEKWRYCRTYH